MNISTSKCYTLKNTSAFTKIESNGPSVLSNQTGSTLLILILFLSSFGLFFLGPLAKMLSTLQQTQNQLHICRDTVYRGQAQASRELDQLMGLNTMAKSLRVARKAAEVAAKMAQLTGEPFTIAKTQAALQVVKASQATLKLTQQALLAKIKASWASDSIKVRQRLQKAGATMVIVRSPNLPVRPDRTPDAAPVYEVKKNFFKETAWHVSWRYQPRVQSPAEQNARKRFAKLCAANLIYEKNSWDYTATEDKSWLKLSSFF